MHSYQDQGFIIKIKPSREADRLVSILTKKHGKFVALAKGAAKILSRKTGTLDLLNLNKFLFYKSRSNYDLIIESELIDDFIDVKTSLVNISQIFYILEIIDKIALGEETSDENLFDSLYEFLALWRQYSKQKDNLLAAFEIQTLRLTGFEPDLDYCIFCKAKLLPDSNRIAASSGEAGYLCDKHFDFTQKSKFLVPDNVLKIQKYYLNNQLLSAIKLNTTSHDQKRIEGVQKVWLEGIIENRLKSANFIDQVKNSKVLSA